MLSTRVTSLRGLHLAAENGYVFMPIAKRDDEIEREARRLASLLDEDAALEGVRRLERWCSNEACRPIDLRDASGGELRGQVIGIRFCGAKHRELERIVRAVR